MGFHTCFLHGCWGVKHRSSCLYNKHFSSWAFSPAPPGSLSTGLKLLGDPSSPLGDRPLVIKRQLDLTGHSLGVLRSCYCLLPNWLLQKTSICKYLIGPWSHEFRRHCPTLRNHNRGPDMFCEYKWTRVISPISMWLLLYCSKPCHRLQSAM